MSIPGGRATHFTDAAAFQGCVEVNRAITDVGWANRHWVARQCGTRIACPYLVFGGVDDHNGTLLQAAQDFKRFPDGLQVIG